MEKGQEIEGNNNNETDNSLEKAVIRPFRSKRHNSVVQNKLREIGDVIRDI